MEPFSRKCGWRTAAVAKDGDCFYTCVVEALGSVGTEVRAPLPAVWWSRLHYSRNSLSRTPLSS